MVERDLRRRGVDDDRVLAAMATVPREAFVPEPMVGHAYDDNALPIGSGQTISQPFIVAAMAEAAGVGPGDRVLEIGTGSGYGAAVLRELGASVVTVERLPELSDTARHALVRQGYDDVEVVTGDGTLGWPEGAPYAAIVVTAAGPVVPDPLVEQLADGGRLVMPVGPHGGPQRLVVIERHGDERIEQDFGGVAFVPLVGDEGW
jgi:protein-L-isoaspartate(D-aspartate) O-methyltransferase